MKRAGGTNASGVPESAAASPQRSGAGGVPWPAAYLALAAIWGCSFWWMKLGLEVCAPVDVAFVRLSFGALALLVVVAVTRTRIVRSARTWMHLFVVAILLSSVPFTLFAFGETRISAALAGILNALTPLTTLVASLTVFRDVRPTTRMCVGLAVGFAGVLVVIGIWQGIGSGPLVGVLACVGAVCCYGLSFPYTRHFLLGRDESPIALASGQTILGSLQLLPFALGLGHLHIGRPVGAWVALLGLGVLGSGIAYLLNLHVIAGAGITIASTVTYLSPVFAVVVAALALGEPIAWYEPVGGVVVLLGAALSQDRFRQIGAMLRRQPA